MWRVADIEPVLGAARFPPVMSSGLNSAAQESGAPDGGQEFTSVSIDTRTLRPGALFFCIQGDRTDGHEYIAQALSAGARGVVVSRFDEAVRGACQAQRVPVFVVPDTTGALAELARAHRMRIGARVVGVTGSNGKTTTKELLAGMAEILAPGTSLATEGNLNNHWGLPLSLLRATEKHRLLILEMGMNHPGEIGSLSRIAKPDVGVIVSISGAHIGHFSSVEDIARAKLELVEGMAPGAFLLYNRRAVGLDLAERLATERRLVLCRFGVEDRSKVTVVSEGLRFQWRGHDVLAPDWFNPELADNRIAALEALVALGYAERDVVAASAAVRANVPGRFSVSRRNGSRGVQALVDDTYNANEASFVSAVEAAAGLAPTGRLALVAGEMAELGAEAAAAHIHVGRTAAASGFDLVVAVGDEHAEELARAFQKVRPQGRVRRASSSADVVADAALLEDLAEHDVVLVKGSRSARMERVVHALREKGYV